MSFIYYENIQTVSYNLILFMRSKGYSRLSLSKLTGISRPEIDQILSGKDINAELFDAHIMRIKQTFGLPNDYFLIKQKDTETESKSTIPINHERSETASECLKGLGIILDIFSMYVKK